MAPGENRTDLYTLLARPAPGLGERTGQVVGVSRDLAVLAAGWCARDWIEQHANEQAPEAYGVVFVSSAGAQPCRPCGRYALAVLRGVPDAEALKFACDQLREMRAQVEAAMAVVDRWTGRAPAVPA